MGLIKRPALLPLVALVLVLLPSLAFAQTGSIAGVARDTQGGVLPGVTVTVSSPSLQGIETTVSEANGAYQFPPLPAGTYRADWVIVGADTHRITGAHSFSVK